MIFFITYLFLFSGAVSCSHNDDFIGNGSVAVAGTNSDLSRQIEDLREKAIDLANQGEKVRLVMGSANHEIQALKDKSSSSSWIFWNKGDFSCAGGSPLDFPNGFIDADFNDGNVIEKVGRALEGKITEIVIPQEAIEYARWTASDFRVFHNMLVSGGSMGFSLDWLGGEGTQIDFFPENADVSCLESAEFVGAINCFSMGLGERLDFLKKKYPSAHFRTRLYPSLSDAELERKIVINDVLREEIQKEIEIVTNIYKASIRESSRLTCNSILENINENKELSINAKSVLYILEGNMGLGDLKYDDSACVGDFITKTVREAKTIDRIRSISSELVNREYENWISSRAFKGIFHEARIIELSDDAPEQDIPSANFKRGSRIIKLIKE